jgi:hypothetical protein
MVLKLQTRTLLITFFSLRSVFDLKQPPTVNVKAVLRAKSGIRALFHAANCLKYKYKWYYSCVVVWVSWSKQRFSVQRYVLEIFNGIYYKAQETCNLLCQEVRYQHTLYRSENQFVLAPRLILRSQGYRCMINIHGSYSFL